MEEFVGVVVECWRVVVVCCRGVLSLSVTEWMDLWSVVAVP